jgi:hypothetical protein
MMTELREKLEVSQSVTMTSGTCPLKERLLEFAHRALVRKGVQ